MARYISRDPSFSNTGKNRTPKNYLFTAFDQKNNPNNPKNESFRNKSPTPNIKPFDEDERPNLTNMLHSSRRVKVDNTFFIHKNRTYPNQQISSKPKEKKSTGKIANKISLKKPQPYTEGDLYSKKLNIEKLKDHNITLSNRITVTQNHVKRRDIHAFGEHNINPSFFQNIQSKDSFSVLVRDMNLNQKNTRIGVPAKQKNINSGSISTRRNEFSSSRDLSRFRITYSSENFISILDKFIFGDCLGQGSFARVYSAYDKENNRKVAIKVIDKSKLSNEKRRLMAQMEIDAMKVLQEARKSKIDGENICELLAVLEDSKRVRFILNNKLGFSEC